MAELCSKCRERPAAFVKHQSNTLCRECLQEEDKKSPQLLSEIRKSEDYFLLEMIGHLKVAVELGDAPSQQKALMHITHHIARR
jgi:hypothetical protein